MVITRMLRFFIPISYGQKMKTTGKTPKKFAALGVPRGRYPTAKHELKAQARQSDLRRAREVGVMVRYERQRRVISAEQLDQIESQMYESRIAALVTTRQ